MMETDQTAESFVCSSSSEAFVLKLNTFIKMDVVEGKAQPIARSGHRAVANDDFMWVLGGYNPNNSGSDINQAFSLFKDLWRYNISTNEWVSMKTDDKMPSELASHSAIRHNQLMMVFGGTGVPFGEQSSDKLTVCHLGTGRWSPVECAGPGPDKIYGQAMAVIGEHLYVYGGTTGHVYNTELHRLDLNANVWHKVKPSNAFNELPNERYRHEIAIDDDDKIFVLGGGTSQAVYSLRQIYIFSVRANKWEVKAAKRDPSTKGYPRARRCHSCVQLRASAYICGGYDGDVILGDLWKLDLKTLQWRKLSDMPEPVYFHSAAVTSEGCMIVFGGVTCIEKSSRTASCYRVWLEVPSLQTMAWFALLELCPALKKMPRKDLIKLGIGRNLIGKLLQADGA